jgi:hypothetical protein
MVLMLTFMRFKPLNTKPNPWRKAPRISITEYPGWVGALTKEKI